MQKSVLNLINHPGHFWDNFVFEELPYRHFGKYLSYTTSGKGRLSLAPSRTLIKFMHLQSIGGAHE